MDYEAFTNVLLDRIERNAQSANKHYRMFQQAHQRALHLDEDLRAAQAANRQHEANMKLAQEKIAEWAAHAEKLRDIIWAAPRPDGKLPDFPDVPNDLEFPIPF